MTRGTGRIERIVAGLREDQLDALICTLPTNVLLLSGYWPVVGTAVAIVTREGRVHVLAPEDEEDLAASGWATDVHPFQPGSLTRLTPLEEAVRGPLAEVATRAGITTGRIGYEAGASDEPASYASLSVYGSSLGSLIRDALPQASLTSASALLARLKGTLTATEVGQVRAACAVAGLAFTEGVRGLRAGLSEAEVAAHFQAPLSVVGLARGAQRAGGFVYCMSGPNAALAGAAYARARSRLLHAGDLVLVHCNSYVDGYWTDITRTYCLGEPTARQRDMSDAVFAARAAALDTIRPGVRAAAVDAAARSVLTQRGYGHNFTHATGHGVGFSAINGLAHPRIHPAADDVLAVDMVFNVEPAIYVTGYGGLRHCDMVAVGEHGAEVLTPFHAASEHLILASPPQPSNGGTLS